MQLKKSRQIAREIKMQFQRVNLGYAGLNSKLAALIRMRSFGPNVKAGC